MPDAPVSDSQTLPPRAKPEAADLSADAARIPAVDPDAARGAEAARAAQEQAEDSVTEPGGFRNDPDDSSNPNEVIERHRRKLRP